ncbi:hypothetical protein SKAU_G00215620 [Synaphobranchus kaupii]|uniref:Uncharacterized protein n=1 Tax=Synaphobranchus kaupii TaxID=118154 RepID=A0A9Q1F9W2_SYNKA|nr:hypothetical protein SKAU_G00215620 [Synaphobranchus kaupii]
MRTRKSYGRGNKQKKSRCLGPDPGSDLRGGAEHCNTPAQLATPETKCHYDSVLKETATTWALAHGKKRMLTTPDP